MRKQLFTALCMLLLCIGMKAQVSGYSFSQTSTTYVPLSTVGATTLHATGWDDAVATATVPFSFYFAGSTYTTCSVNSNGYLTFGTTVSGTTGYTPISAATAYNGAISAFGRDQVDGATGSQNPIICNTIGTAPNRIFVVQWTGARRYSLGALTGDVYNYQICLNEGGGAAVTQSINIIYGACTTTNTATGITAQVGLRGATNADFNNRNTLTDWNTTTLGASNTASCLTTPAINPASGLSFNYMPPASCIAPTAQPTALVFGVSTNTTVAASFTGITAATTPGYLVIRTLGTAPNTPTNGVTYTAGASAALNGTVVSVGTSNTFTATGLTGNTNYSYYIYSYTGVNCTGGPLYYTVAPLTGTATTCPARVTAVTNTLVTSNSFDLTWTAPAGGSASAITYSIEVSSNAGFTAPVAGSPFLVPAPTTSVSVTGLNPATQYYYRVTAHNGCNIGPATSSNTTTAGIPTDLQTVQLIAPAVNALGCYSSSIPVVIQIRNAGTGILDFSTNNATIVTAITGTNPQTFTTTLATGTLAAGATQNVTVTATYNMSATGSYTINASGTLATPDANTANNAIPAAVRTVAAPATLPQLVTFTGYAGTATSLSTAFPGWNEGANAVTPTIGSESTFTVTNSTAQTGLYGAAAKMNLYTTNVGWLISPKFVPTASHWFKYKAAVVNYDAVTSTTLGVNDTVRAMISTNCGASWIPLRTFTNASNQGLNGSTNVLREYFENLSAYAGQTVMVAIYARRSPTATSPDIDIVIDDMEINTCFPPTALTTTNTTTTGTDLSWTAPGGGSPANYQYEIRTSGAAGSGATGLVTTGTVTAPSTSVTATGLTAITAYTVYVRSNCGGPDFSAWTPGKTFTTSAACPVPTTPTVTNIAGYSAVATWTAGGSETLWDVYFGPTPLTAPTATTVPTATVSTTPSYTMSALTPTTGYAVYVRANCGAGNTSTWSAVRNFTTTVSCPAPTTLAISAITPTTAVATWTNSGPATSWIFRYALPTTTVSVSGTPSYTMTGLTPSTTYSAQVRGYCGVGDTSTWTTNVIFMTPCLPPNITGTTPGSRCGIGTVTLGVTGDPGALFQWYTTAVSPLPVATGSVYTTPTLTNTTNFYVSASNVSTGSRTYGAGALTGTGVAYNPTQGGYGGLKGQYLYTAAELRAAGLTAGNITSMGFEITATGATLNGFAVEVGTTTLTAFPTPVNILGGLTTVAPAFTFTPTVGVNTINFSTPFNWDGVSNIVVSTSWSNNNASNTSSTVKYDNTTNFASQDYRKDNETAANMFAFTGATGAGTFTYDRTQTRPTMRFAGNVLCESTRTMVAATVNAPPALTVSSATTVCANVISTVSVTSTVSDYDSYIWSPVTNLYTDAAATIPYAGGSASTLYYKSAVNGTTAYTLTANNSVSGCANVISTSRSTQVPTINASATPSVVCSGAAVTLSATTNVIGSGTVAVGTGTNLTLGNTAEPTAFCNRYTGYRMQAVYTAAELNAAGLYAGNITSIAYNITTLGSASTNPLYTVKCGTTSVSAFTNFVSNAGFTTCFPAATYTHAVGVNVIPFSTPFNWDGVSNLVVEVTHDGVDASNSSQTYYTPTAGNTIVYSNYNNATGTPGTMRLNIVFGGQTQAQGAGGLTWQWNPGAINSNTTTVMPVNTGTNPSTASYTITGTDPATTCSGSVAVTVTVNPVPTVPVTLNSIQCGVGTPSASVSGGATYRWYATPTSTTVLQSGASTTYTTAISATTTFYVSSYNANCESARAAITASVSIPDAISATSTSSAVCPGQSFTLTAVDTGTNNVYSYTWTATPAAGSGIATSVTGTTISVTPVTPGSYNYVVTGSDAVCTATAAVTVMLSTPPQIIASASPSVACLGSTVTLNAMTGTIASGTVGIGVPTLTLSAFGDAGNPYNYWYGGQKEQYIFTAAELSAAGLTTGNITALSFDVVTSTALSMNNFSMTVGHTAQPASTFNLITSGLSTVYFNAAQPVTAGINNYVFTTPFNWNGTDNVVVSLSWSNVNSGNTALTPSVRAHNAGFNSTGYLYADNTAASAIAAATTSLSAGVGGTSQNNVTTNRPNIIFTGQRLTTGASGLTWQWNPGAVNSNTTTVVPSTPGTPSYTVTATDPATTCSNTAVVTITVNPVPSVTVAASTGSICSGTTASLTATGATTYSWMPAGGTSSVAVVSPTASTVYTVTGTSLGCSNTQTVNLNVTPTPTVVASASPSVICAGATVSLTASGATTYSWMPNSSTSGTTTATPTVSTTYTVSGTTSGCTNTRTLTVTVNNVPTLTITTTPTAGVLCTTGATATLTAAGTSTAYAWNTGATTASISVAPSATTVYTVTGTNSCGVRTATTTITVATTPTIAAAASSSIICAGNSAVLTTSATAGVTYSWNTGASTMSISVSPSVTTTYTVTGTNACGTATATVVQNVSPCIGIEEMAGGADISIYPNPASDYVNIAVPANLTTVNATVEVTDALGKLVMKETINTDVTTLRISKLEDGVYFFKVITNNQAVKVGKVVKH